jgi:gliding motility-associated-like protein
MKKIFLLFSLAFAWNLEVKAQVLPPPPTISVQPASPVSYCRNVQATISFSASGFLPGYQWYITGPPGCEFCESPLSNNTIYSGVNTNALRINTNSLTAENYYYFCTVSNAGGSVYTITVQFTVLTSIAPNAPTTTSNSRCGSGSVTLGAAGGVAGQYRWYTVATGGIAIIGQTAATYATPALTGTTNYYVAINNGTCESNRTIVTAIINPIPAAPSTTGASRCGSGSVTLNAAGGTAGQYRWYTVATGGTAIAGETNAAYTTATLTGTTNYYVAINNGTCESNRTIVAATIIPLPTAPTTSGASRCGNGSVTLGAAGGTGGQYRWYTVATGGTAITGQTAATYTTPALTGTTNYYVAINNGTCESIRTIVTATIDLIPTAPSATGASNCGSGTVILNAAGGTAGQYRWYTVATGGTAIAGETIAAYTTPSLTGTTNYYVAINNGTCESNRTMVTATINPLPTAPTTTGGSICGSGTVTLNASGGATGQYRWYTAATGGTAIAGQTNAAYTTPSLTGTTNYYVAINNGTCESNRTIVTATINPIPTAPTTTGASICGSGTVILNTAGGTAGQYRWYTVATGGTAIAGQTNADYTTPTLTGTTNYYVAINDGTCESNRTIVTATINPIPTAPTTTGGSICGSGTLTLNASGGTAGQYRWYTVATGGTAIAGQTAATYTTPVLTGTTNYYVAINDGTCESNRTIVTATINPLPTAPTTTGASSCGSGTVILNAAGGTAGQYRWYILATGGTAIAGQTAATYTTPVLTGTTNYYVAINDGTCESNRTIVTATINPLPTAPTTTGASSCGSGTVILNAAGGTAGQYRWYTVATGGTSIAGQTNAAYTTPTLTGTTNYYVAINNGTCESNRTIVTAIIDPIPTAPTTTGASSCGSGTVTLNASGGTAGQYRWYTVATGGTAISGQTNAAYTTPTLTGTTNYYVAINNGTCESNRTIVTAIIDPIPTAPTTTGASSCGSGTVTLNASGGTAGQYRWYTVATGGTAIAGQINAAYTTPTLTGTTNYYVAINNGTCESNRTIVTATIDPIPTAPTTTGASNCGSGILTLNASGGTAGQYRWYTVATGGTAIAGQTNAAYTTSTLTGTTNYYVTINNGTCESNRTIVTAIIDLIPTAPTTTGASSCGIGTVTLNASGGVAGQYRWYTVDTGGTSIAGQTNAAYTTPTLTGTTNYYVAINNGTCESNRTIVTATINTPPTAPSTTGASICGSGAVTLNAAGGVAGQYRWYTVATGGTSIAGQTNAAYTTPTLTGTTNYYVAINNGTCESNRTIVTATINPVPLAPVTTGNSSCVSASLLLTATGGSNGEYRWYTTPTGGVAISGETNGTFTTPVLSVSTNYYVALNNGSCEGPRSLVFAEINSTPTAPTTTAGSRCGSGSVTLNAAGAINGQYRWYTTNTGGTALAGQTSSTYSTPILDTNTQYFVSISFGACESTRTAVVATINPIPTSPVTSDVVVCGTTTTLLKASGAQNGQYRWYDATQNLIPAQTNNELNVGVITTSRIFYVSAFIGQCESSLVAIQVVVDNNTCNSAPTITPKTEITEPGGSVRINVLALVSDPDNNIDPASLKIISPPSSGASAAIENGFLVIDYKGLIFAGIDKITIEVCDLSGSCIRQEIIISVEGDVRIYNGMSPNGDNKNEKWIIKNIESLPEAQNNKVSLFNRWGNQVFEMTRYNNQDRVFTGLSDKGEAVPSGIYFYKIEFLDGTKPALTGYITIKK